MAAVGEDDSNVGSEADAGNDWKQDVGERSRRIYEWWKALMNARNGDIPAFQEAVRLVAITQVSSASVERVFSQLTFIRRAVGDNTLRDLIELRAYIRCNHGLTGQFKIEKR